MKFVPIPPEDITKLVDARPQEFNRLAIFAGTTGKELLEKANNGLIHVIVIWDDEKERIAALMTASKVIRNGVAVCSLENCIGDGMTSWVHLIDECAAWAKETLGASGVMIEGRAGWGKVMNKFGFRQTGIILERSA